MSIHRKADGEHTHTSTDLELLARLHADLSAVIAGIQRLRSRDAIKLATEALMAVRDSVAEALQDHAGPSAR